MSSRSENTSPYVGPSVRTGSTSRGDTRIRPRTSTDRPGWSQWGPTRT